MSDLQRAIQRGRVDKLITLLMQTISGKEMTEVNSRQRAVFNHKMTKPFGQGIVDVSRANQSIDDILPLVLDKLCQSAVRREFALLSREELTKRMTTVGKEQMMSEIKAAMEKFIRETL